MQKLSSGQSFNGGNDIDVLVQGCNISSALAMEVLQSCVKPSIYIGLETKYSNW